jgi:general secretion pathway protein D
MLTDVQLRRALLSTSRLGVLALVLPAALAAQSSNANRPAAVPAGAQPTAPSQQAAAPAKPVSARNAREADNDYIDGAKLFQKHDYAGAEKLFGHALALNPQEADYIRAFAYAREGRITDLVHQATLARLAGNVAKANALLEQARQLDPNNRIVAEHLSDGGDVNSAVFDPLRFPAANIASTLAGAIHLAPDQARHDIHERGDAQSVLTAVYRTFGLQVQFNAPLTGTKPIRFDLDNVTFDTATRLLHRITKTFAVVVQPKVALIAADTQDNRDRLEPLIEETIYLRGMTSEQMQDLANLARNIYDVKTVTASATGGTILLRDDEPTLRLVNAEYADMLDGSSDVLLDVTLYEVDTSRTRNFGVTLPQSLSFFDIAEEASNILTANQSLIQAALQSGALKLSGNALTDTLNELSLLYAAGALSATQATEFTSLLGTIGNFNGVPLLGLAISSGATINALLQASEAHVVDAVQIRSSDAQKTQFRTGTRYPIETSSYTSGVSGALGSALAGASQAIQQQAAALLGGAGSVTIPQIQYEDLGLTVTSTANIQHNKDIHLQLDFKIESLGAGSLNGIPELNNREFTSTVTVPAGETALLVSSVNTSELKSIQGYPGLNQLPGFQGTEKDDAKSSQELLISITPHLVREPSFRISSRPVLLTHPSGSPSP